MATRRPIVSVSGRRKQLPAGDTIPKQAVPFGGRLYIGDLAPDGALPGDGWLSSVDGAFAVLYDNGTSMQWVVDSGPAGPKGADGANGANGAAGAKGDKGDKGDTGSPGDPSTAMLTIGDQAAARTLPATGSVAIQTFLQTARNCLKWLVARFDADGKALTAVTADSATNAGDATKWNGAAKTVSTSAPSGGADGDIWFQREA